jgi:predicted porin|tara:strand:- start:10774 stop:11703 length:930 start_codon:yes stop_codon:yes gene_type:complete
MKITKKRVGLGVAIVVALGILGWVFKPAPAEATEIDVYGSLNYMISNNEDANGNATSKAENNGSSIGVNFSEELAEGVTGFATIEVDVDTDDSGSSPFDSKLAYAGVDMGDAGTLSAGRQNSVFKNAVTSKTDIFPEYGGKAAQKLFSRDSHTVTYTNSVGPLSIDNMVKVDGSTGKSGVDVYETAATMSINDSIDVGLGYSDDKVNDVQYYGAGVTVALSDDTSVGYNYTTKDTATDVKANEIVAQHSIDGTTLQIGYADVEDGNTYTTFGAKREITESLELYGAYEMADNAGSTDTSGMSVGFKFKF